MMMSHSCDRPTRKLSLRVSMHRFGLFFWINRKAPSTLLPLAPAAPENSFFQVYIGFSSANLSDNAANLEGMVLCCEEANPNEAAARKGSRVRAYESTGFFA
ncbi:MAG: hypothetical protein MZU91_14850 [Desulfosudis oleivorans]|nr:hypothetical protein [Desulfosudis oleivorans]